MKSRHFLCILVTYLEIVGGSVRSEGSRVRAQVVLKKQPNPIQREDMPLESASERSISHWIANLKHGDEDAAQALWSRFSNRLLDCAKKRLGKSQTGIADEEDVAQLAFASLCRGASEGRFKDVRNRDELWWILLTITKRKATDHLRRETAQKRGGGRVRSETHFRTEALGEGLVWSFDHLVGKDPTPDELVILSEEYQNLMSRLGDRRLRNIAMLRIEGYTVTEIAEKLSIAKRSVERKLRLIRDNWSYAIAMDAD